MYKVYTNGLLNALSNHCYAIFINGLSLSSLSFADDISLMNFTSTRTLELKKKYVGSFYSNIDDNIEKKLKKDGMIFSSNLDRRKINPLIYVKFWRQACLPSLLYGAEIFTLTPTMLTKLEHCQSWSLKIIFYVLKFAPNLLLQSTVRS